MKNLVKPVAIVVFLTLSLVAIIFGVQQGIRHFLRAEVEPSPSPAPLPSPPTIPSPSPAVVPTYNLQDFQEFLNAMGTASTKWDLNNDGTVNETDLTIFKTHYRQ